ncbi:hypothetical protein ACU686_42340 [Yinghuangia aomiensis]
MRSTPDPTAPEDPPPHEATAAGPTPGDPVSESVHAACSSASSATTRSAATSTRSSPMSPAAATPSS